MDSVCQTDVAIEPLIARQIMHWKHRHRVCGNLFVTTLLGSLVFAQANPIAIKPDSATLFWLADQGDHGRFAQVEFSQGLSQLPSVGQIHLTAKPSNTSLVVSNPRFPPGNTMKLEVDWTLDILPKKDDTQFTITIDQVTTSTGTTSNLHADGPLYQRANVQAFIDAQKKAFDDAIAIAKTSEEKNIFASLSVSAPTSGSTAGDADIHLNRWVGQNVFLSLTLNKSSAEKADPKHFDTSFTFRKVFLFLSKPPRGGPTNATLFQKQNERASVEAIRHRRLLGVLLDGGGRFEGDATNFGVTNAVFQMPIQLASRTMGFGPLGSNGFWKFRLVPAGVEAGHNLGSENPNLKQYNILRYVSGVTFGLVYDPNQTSQNGVANPNSFLPTVELTGAVAARYLFNSETAWDVTTKSSSLVSSGMRPWYQADLKVFLFSSGQGRAGFKVTFEDGSQPPVFSKTHAFRFGLVYETSDDKTAKGTNK
jgi:hypothetical protein